MPGIHTNPLMAYDDTLGWVCKPDYSTELRESALSAFCRTNRWGFRDDQPPGPDKTTEKTRLMFLGDSFVMGTGIDKDDRVSEIIESRDTTFISYNFGLFGYSTDQELLALKKFGPEVQPNWVLLFFCANDLIYNDCDFGHRVPKPHFHVDDNGSLQLGNVPVPPLPGQNSLRRWMENNLALAQITTRVLARLAFRQEQEKLRPTGKDLGLADAGDERANLDSLLLFSPASNIGDLTYYLLKEMRDECRRLGARFILFTTPSNHHWTTTRQDTPAEIQRVLDWCAELDIPAVDLFPSFYRDYADQGRTLYLRDKMHWNEHGHRLAARELLKMLTSTDTSPDESKP